MNIGNIEFEEKVPYENIRVCLDALKDAGLNLVSMKLKKQSY